MGLQERIENLPEEKQIELSIKLLEIGLPIWTEFAQNNKLEYTDTVVGMHHRIDENIVDKAISFAKVQFENKEGVLKSFLRHRATKFIEQEFWEPITALQDLDWEIPEPPKLVFYSAYNLIEKLAGKENSVLGELIIYVSINQSIDAIQRKGIISNEEVREIVKNAG